MTQIQKQIDAAVQVLVARAGFNEAQARELILAQRAKSYVAPPVWKNAPRLVVVQ
jgi:hypothetical protein